MPMQQILAGARAHRIPTLSYHLDLYVGIPERWQSYRNDPYVQGLDHFFTVEPMLVDYLNTLTTVRGHYLTAGVLADECYLAKPLPETYPVIFVGSYHYHPSWPYRPRLIDWLRATYGDRFHGFGPDFGEVIRGDRLNRVYASTKIAVGDSYSPNFDYPGFWSDRIPETLGRGGFLIHPRIKGIDDFYEDRRHLVLYDFGDFDQLKALIDHYLEHDEEREAIRRAGHEHVKAHHTYRHRWQHIIEKVFGCSHSSG